MSKVITLRVSDEVLAKLDGATENRSRFVSELIEKWSGGESGAVAKVERATVAMAEAKAINTIERKRKEDSARPTPVIVAHGGHCIQPGHQGFQRTDGWWCTTCRKLY